MSKEVKELKKKVKKLEDGTKGIVEHILDEVDEIRQHVGLPTEGQRKTNPIEFDPESAETGVPMYG